jgi:hypothetical protein
MSAESRKQDRGRQTRRARALCHNDYLQFQSSTDELGCRYADPPSTARSTHWDDETIYARSSSDCDFQRCSAWNAKSAGSAFLSASRPFYTTDVKGRGQSCYMSMCCHNGTRSLSVVNSEAAGLTSSSARVEFRQSDEPSHCALRYIDHVAQYRSYQP